MEIPSIGNISDNLVLKQKEREGAMKKIREENKKVQPTDTNNREGDKGGKVDEQIVKKDVDIYA